MGKIKNRDAVKLGVMDSLRQHSAAALSVRGAYLPLRYRRPGNLPTDRMRLDDLMNESAAMTRSGKEVPSPVVEPVPVIGRLLNKYRVVQHWARDLFVTDKLLVKAHSEFTRARYDDLDEGEQPDPSILLITWRKGDEFGISQSEKGRGISARFIQCFPVTGEVRESYLLVVDGTIYVSRPKPSRDLRITDGKKENPEKRPWKVPQPHEFYAIDEGWDRYAAWLLVAPVTEENDEKVSEEIGWYDEARGLDKALPTKHGTHVRVNPHLSEESKEPMSEITPQSLTSGVASYLDGLALALFVMILSTVVMEEGWAWLFIPLAALGALIYLFWRVVVRFRDRYMYIEQRLGTRKPDKRVWLAVQIPRLLVMLVSMIPLYLTGAIIVYRVSDKGSFLEAAATPSATLGIAAYIAWLSFSKLVPGTMGYMQFDKTLWRIHRVADYVAAFVALAVVVVVAYLGADDPLAYLWDLLAVLAAGALFSLLLRYFVHFLTSRLSPLRFPENAIGCLYVHTDMGEGEV